jgi:hypothetical protein
MLEAFDFALVSATIMRGKEGHYLDGVWRQLFDDPVTIKIINPLPLRSNELEMLPEGERALNYVKSFVETNIHIRDGAKDADLIVCQGKTYKVVQLSPYTLDGQTVNKVIMREVKADET